MATVDSGYQPEPTGALPGELLVSIHCITYNHGAFISEALDSFLAQQTSFGFEIVVGEDCSSDNTREVVEDYIRKHPGRIKLIVSDRNVGVAANFERVLKACSGKYVAICEGDDYWIDPGKLQAQVDFLEHARDFVVCYHDAIPFDESGFEQYPQLPKSLQTDASERALVRGRPISTLTACFRNVVRELPAEIRVSPVIDLCLWSLLGHFGKGKYLAHVRPAAYRKHAHGLMSLRSHDHRQRNTAQAFLCLARYYERIEMPELASHFTCSASIACGRALSAPSKVQVISALGYSLLPELFRKILARLLGR